MVSLKKLCNQIQEVSCIPNIPNTIVNCIDVLVPRRDGDKCNIDYRYRFL